MHSFLLWASLVVIGQTNSFHVSNQLCIPGSIVGHKGSLRKLTNIKNEYTQKDPILTTELSMTTFSSQEKRRKDNRISFLLSISYMSIIASVMVLSACLSVIELDMSGVMLFATLATMAGKLLLGPPTDMFGGQATLQMAMVGMAALLYATSITQTGKSFRLYWVAFSFLYSSTWGAIGKIVHENFPPNQWATQINIVAAASRFGSLLSALVYGMVVKAGWHWRGIFRVVGVIQVVAFVLFSSGGAGVWSNRVVDEVTQVSEIVGGDVGSASNERGSESESESVGEVLQRVTRDPKFVLMLLGKLPLMVVGQFLQLVPMYLETAVKMSRSSAITCSSTFALGSLVANLFGSRVYHKLSSSRQIRLVFVFNVIGVLCSSSLFLHSLGLFPLNGPVASSILLVWGGAWALPFYTPPALMALTLGGRQHSALLTNMFDGAGFLAGAIFSDIALGYGRRGVWRGSLLTMALGSCMTTASMLVAMILQDHEKRGKKIRT
eukprot:gene8040-16478_t